MNNTIIDKDLTTIAYRGFLSFNIESDSCVDFLKAIMPDGFCESIYDEFWKNTTPMRYVL